ncbi:MAG: family 43 glycosylhydrolase [Bacteroidota bacterium]
MLIYTYTNAQNPISPPGIYLADPSARSWNDSTLYLYTSTDLSCDFWCSWKHDILYTSDMVEWQVAGNTFTSKGVNDEVSYNDQLLFAPDCAKKDDTYYLYYCQPDENNALGTATSKSPTGPFKEGRILNTGKKYSQIDPAVFLDDDGVAYLVWGQTNMKMAALKPDMRTIDTTSIKDLVLTKSEHYFHEGPYMTKVNDLYYIVYADESRNQKPTSLGYATSKTPFGPYTYRGVIIDNEGCNPGNWNNHGSIYNFKNQWYVFYHRSTHGCQTYRKACVEKIEFLADGSIPEVEMTTQGALPPLNALNKLEAERACLLSGKVMVENDRASNQKLTNFKNGDEAVYKYLNFGDGASTFKIRYCSPKQNKLLLFTGLGKERKKVAELDFVTSKEQDGWRVDTFSIQKLKGIHALTLQIQGQEGILNEIDWFAFSR